MPSSLSARLRRALPRVRMTRRRAIAGSTVLVLLVAVVGWAVWPQPASYRTEDRMIAVKTGPAGDQSVTLDTRLYMPKNASKDNQVPAVLLAHGFGGTKQSVTTDAKDLADLGPVGEPVDQGLRVLDLPVGAVEVDLPGRAARQPARDRQGCRQRSSGSG